MNTLFDVIEFNLSNWCNRTCSFCPQSYAPRDRKKEFMDVNLYNKIIDDVYDLDANYPGKICYSGFAEQLENPHLFKYIEYTKQVFPKVPLEVLTNGDGLTKELIDKFFKNDSILKISAYDEKHYNHILDLTKGYENLRIEGEKSDVTDDIMKIEIRKRFGDNITRWNNRAGSLSDFKDLNLNKVCYYPFYMMYIDWNGDFLFCSHDYAKQRIIGNLNESSARKLWYSEELNKIRRMMLWEKRDFAPCSKCDVWGQLRGEHKYNDWKKSDLL